MTDDLNDIYSPEALAYDQFDFLQTLLEPDASDKTGVAFLTACVKLCGLSKERYSSLCLYIADMYASLLSLSIPKDSPTILEATIPLSGDNSRRDDFLEAEINLYLSLVLMGDDYYSAIQEVVNDVWSKPFQYRVLFLLYLIYLYQNIDADLENSALAQEEQKVYFSLGSDGQFKIEYTSDFFRTMDDQDFDEDYEDEEDDED